MPTYEYACSSCGDTFTRILSISRRKEPTETPCEKCGESKVDQVTLTAPSLGDPVRLGLIKPDSGFKEALQRIHEKSPGSQLNTGSSITSI